MWIVKPCNESQGREIKVFESLQKILLYAGIDRNILNNLSLNIQQNPKNEQFGNTQSKKDWVI
jgi:hypothetical protein